MTVKSKPKTRRERFTSWKEERKYGVEMTLSNIQKFETLDRILRKDMDDLGIKQIAVFIEPKKWGSPSIHRRVLRIKGKDKRAYPSAMIFDYRTVQKLNVQELRSIGMHELGHYIFEYYYPGIAQYPRRMKEHDIIEAFANEFAYRRFGSIYINAIKKAMKATGVPKSAQKMNMKELRKMKEHVEQYGHGYWKEVAREKNISVKYDPKSSIIICVNPKREVLGNLR